MIHMISRFSFHIVPALLLILTTKRASSVFFFFFPENSFSEGTNLSALIAIFLRLISYNYFAYFFR